MRTSLWILASALAAQAIAQGPYFSEKELPRSAKPALPLAPFAKVPVISVTEYIRKKGDPPLFVYRYSYRAELEAEVRRLRKLFPASAGWKDLMPKRKPGDAATYERLTTAGSVRRQAVLVMPGKLVRDESAKHKVRGIPTPGENWVRVSYNEFRASRVSISSRNPLSTLADGEEIGSTPAEFQIAPGAARVMIPRTASTVATTSRL